MVMYNVAGKQEEHIQVTSLEYFLEILPIFFSLYFIYVLAYTQKEDKATFTGNRILEFRIMMIHAGNISQLELQESTATSGILTLP